MADNIQFDSKIRKRGGSYYMLIPPEIRTYLKLRDNKNIKIQTENGQHGPYISVWNPNQQDKADFKKAAELKQKEK